MDHTAYLQLHQCLPLPRKRSPDGASPDWGCAHLIAAYSSFIYPRKDDRLSRPGWLTYSGRFTHISGHQSAAGRARDRESSPVRDRRSTTVHATQPTHRQTDRQTDRQKSNLKSGAFILTTVETTVQRTNPEPIIFTYWIGICEKGIIFFAMI